MVQIIEILVILWVVAMVVRIATGRFVVTIVTLFSRLFAIACGWLIGWGVFAFGASSMDNPIGRLLIAVGAGVITSIIIALIGAWLFIGTGRKSKNDECPSAAKRLDTRLSISSRVNRAASVIVACVYLMVFTFAAAVFGQILSSSGAALEPIKNSLVIRHFVWDKSQETKQVDRFSYQPISDDTNMDSQMTASSIEDARTVQDQLFGGLRRSVDQSRDWVLEKTGTDAFVEQFNALQDIAAMPDEQKEWIVRHHPDILALVDNPTILQAVENDRVIELVNKASNGSVIAVYQLGDEPDVQALFDDPQVRKLIAEIDLIDIREKVRNEFDERRKHNK